MEENMMDMTAVACFENFLQQNGIQPAIPYSLKGSCRPFDVLFISFSLFGQGFLNIHILTSSLFEVFPKYLCIEY